jgi:hypothetical protein
LLAPRLRRALTFLFPRRPPAPSLLPPPPLPASSALKAGPHFPIFPPAPIPPQVLTPFHADMSAMVDGLLKRMAEQIAEQDKRMAEQMAEQMVEQAKRMAEQIAEQDKRMAEKMAEQDKRMAERILQN